MIQLQVLSYLLETKDYSLVTLNNINEDFFSEYKDEFNYIKDHVSRYGNVPDKETFLSKFTDFDLVAVAESPTYLVDKLYEDRNIRYIATTFNKIRYNVNNQNTDVAVKAIMDAAEKLATAKHLHSVDILHDTSRYDDYVDRSNDFAKYYVKTGFKELDALVGGWDRKEELATIVARPGVGKSWLLLLVALTAAQQGLKVGIYSGEMSENKVGYRLDTLFSHLSNTKMIHGNLSIQNEYKKYIDTVGDTIKGSIKVITPAMLGGYATVNSLRAFVEKENLDMLCIDQYSLLADQRKGKSAIERASNISMDLKALQVLKKIPIISVSQQNREKAEDGVSTANIAQSDRFGQDSTVVIFLEQKDNVLTVTLTKARDSIAGKKLQYAVDFDKGIFTYLPNEKDALDGNQCEELRQEYESEDTSGGDVF